MNDLDTLMDAIEDLNICESSKVNLMNTVRRMHDKVWKQAYDRGYSVGVTKDKESK